MDPPTLPTILSNASISNPNLPTDLDPSESSFKVYVRARPLNQKELLSENPKKRLNIIRKHENIVKYNKIKNTLYPYTP